MVISNKHYQDLKLKTLTHFWGYSTFRKPQEKIIDSIISGYDTMVLLPTGAGKSICFQIPAIIQEGTCLVISPLLALMRDQVTNLQRKGIEAEYLSSELDDQEAEIIYKSCKDGITKLLYISPERLTQPKFLQQIEDIHLSFIAVDEAHCISEWGQDFRPSYQNIKLFKTLYPKIPCIALTGTATEKVLEEIQDKIGLQKPKIFKESFLRNNLNIIIEKTGDKLEKTANILKYNPNSGIIYTRTRKQAECTYEFLKHKQNNYVQYFHAGLTPKEKHQRQNEWQNSNLQTLIATNAFGMGIDKANVRHITHFSPPSSIENYYQEIGRAGRDNQESFAYMMWDEQELNNFDDILRSQIPNHQEYISIIDSLFSIFQVAENDLPLVTFQLLQQRLVTLSKTNKGKVISVLQFLNNQEIIYLNNLPSKSTIDLKFNIQDLDLLSKKDSYFIEMLVRNLPGLQQHKVSFNENTLSKKLDNDVLYVRERIKELQSIGLLEYIDGAQLSIKFLQPRNSNYLHHKYWRLYLLIQKNKIKKWEEMKFFLQDNVHCKMRLILSYFGEKQTKNCGKCSTCEKNNSGLLGDNISIKILEILNKKPSSVEEIALQLHYYNKESILENLIYLLDEGKVKMLNFHTYQLANSI